MKRKSPFVTKGYAGSETFVTESGKQLIYSRC